MTQKIKKQKQEPVPAVLQNPAARKKAGMRASGVGILCNLLLFGGKLAVGALANSIAIMADAFNNLSDAGSSIVTLAGFKMADKPADREHPFGHGRIEYVSGLVVAFLILLVGVQLFMSSVEKILHPEALQSGVAALVILVLSIIVKLFMGLYYRHVGQKIDSPSLKAAMTDSISDVVATAAVLLSVAIFLCFQINVDGIIGALVAVFVFAAGIKTVRDTLNPLLGQAPDPQLVEDIKNHVLSYDGVLGLHDLMVHNYGPGQFMASLHVEVAADEDIMKSHDMIDTIERELQTLLHVLTVIHMDPIVMNDERVSQARDEVAEIIKRVEPRVSFHDFRMVEGPSHTNLIFDLLVPYELAPKSSQYVEQIDRAVKQYNSRYFTVITVDKGYVGE